MSLIPMAALDALDAGNCAFVAPGPALFPPVAPPPRPLTRCRRAGGKDVAAYIFDMDETLAKYNCVEVYKVVWCAILEYMHREKGFPADMLALEIDLGWVQKGTLGGREGGRGEDGGRTRCRSPCCCRLS